MEEKWTHRAVGAGVGAIVMLFALPFGAGWYTAGGAKTLASRGSHECAFAALCRGGSGRSGRSRGAES